MVRSIFNHNQFLEVHLETPLAVCEERAPKGLYKKARAGVIKQFTGVSDPYEVPENPEVVINTAELSVADSVKRILDALA